MNVSNTRPLSYFDILSLFLWMKRNFQYWPKFLGSYKNTCMRRSMTLGNGTGAPEKTFGSTASLKRELMKTTNLVPKANFVDTFRGMGTSLGNDKISSQFATNLGLNPPQLKTFYNPVLLKSPYVSNFQTSGILRCLEKSRLTVCQSRVLKYPSLRSCEEQSKTLGHEI